MGEGEVCVEREEISRTKLLFYSASWNLSLPELKQFRTLDAAAAFD